MPRFLMALLLCCALPVAAPAQGLGKENCSATKQILSVAIKGRKAGLTARSLKSQLTTGRAAALEEGLVKALCFPCGLMKSVDFCCAGGAKGRYPWGMIHRFADCTLDTGRHELCQTSTR